MENKATVINLIMWKVKFLKQQMNLFLT